MGELLKGKVLFPGTDCILYHHGRSPLQFVAFFPSYHQPSITSLKRPVDADLLWICITNPGLSEGAVRQQREVGDE